MIEIGFKKRHFVCIDAIILTGLNLKIANSKIQHFDIVKRKKRGESETRTRKNAVT